MSIAKVKSVNILPQSQSSKGDATKAAEPMRLVNRGDKRAGRKKKDKEHIKLFKVFRHTGSACATSTEYKQRDNGRRTRKRRRRKKRGKRKQENRSEHTMS